MANKSLTIKLYYNLRISKQYQFIKMQFDGNYKD